MGVQVRAASGAKLDRLQVLEHTIAFGSDGFADGNELTSEEITRLRRFHFEVFVTEDEKPPVADEPPSNEPDEPSADVNETPSVPPTPTAAPAEPKKPTRPISRARK